MNRYVFRRLPILLFFAGVVGVLGFFIGVGLRVPVERVGAQSTFPLSGHAWSENIGWIQFNGNWTDPGPGFTTMTDSITQTSQTDWTAAGAVHDQTEAVADNVQLGQTTSAPLDGLIPLISGGKLKFYNLDGTLVEESGIISVGIPTSYKPNMGCGIDLAGTSNPDVVYHENRQLKIATLSWSGVYITSLGNRGDVWAQGWNPGQNNSLIGGCGTFYGGNAVPFVSDQYYWGFPSSHYPKLSVALSDGSRLDMTSGFTYAVGDIVNADNDFQEEIIFAYAANASDTVKISLLDNPSDTPDPIYDLGITPASLGEIDFGGAGYFDNDTQLDIFYRYGGNIYYLEAPSSGYSEGSSTNWSRRTLPVGAVIATDIGGLADVDGDGLNEIMYVNNYSGNLITTYTDINGAITIPGGTNTAGVGYPANYNNSPSTTAFFSSGTSMSSPIDLGQVATTTSVQLNATRNGQTLDFKVQTSSVSDFSSDVLETSLFSVTADGAQTYPISGLLNRRYVRLVINFSTTNTSVTPVLHDFTINYEYQVGAPPVTGDFGVFYDVANKIFTGHAWSENIGWVSFDRAETGTPPEAPYNGSEAYTAYFDYQDYPNTAKSVTGWARALNGADDPNDGYDGWIKLNGNTTAGAPWNNGVHLVLDSAGKCDLAGYAWGGEVIGWTSFNCIDTGTCGTNPGNSNYKVTFDNNFCNLAPHVDDLTILNDGSSRYCPAQWAFNFSWTYSDDFALPQKKYQVQIDNDADFSSVEFDTGEITSAANQPIVSVPPDSLLDHPNTPHYWRLRVWDLFDISTDWTIAPGTFITPFNRYPAYPAYAPSFPSVQFLRVPEEPSSKEPVQFTDETIFYDGGSHNWSWTLQNGNPATSAEQNPSTVFNDPGLQTISLVSTDSNGYACTFTETVDINLPLPSYIEVKP